MQKTAFLIFIIGAALALRVTGYGWGGGYLLHPDEQFITQPPYWMALKNTNDPGNYMRPSHFSIRINYFIYTLVSTYRYKQPLEQIYPSYQVFFTYLSRLMVGVWGTVLVLVLYLIGEELVKGAGIWAASIACIFPSYVIHSHYVTPDISLALWLALSMWASLKYAKSGHWIYFLWMCMFTGFAITEKYPGLVYVVFICAHFIFFPNKNAPNVLKNKWISSLIFMSIVFITIFLVSPHLILNFDKVTSAFTSESRTDHVGADGLGWFGNLVFYFQSFNSASGILLWIFIIIGISQLKELKLNVIFILLYPLFFIIILSKVALHWERWAIPFYLFPILLGAIGVNFATRALSKIPVILLISISLVFMLSSSLYHLTYFVQKENTVKQAMAYCMKNGITKENSLYSSWTPFAPSGRFDFDFKGHLENPAYMSSKKYIILSSGAYVPLFNNRPPNFPESVFYKNLLKKRFFHIIQPKIPQKYVGFPWLLDLATISTHVELLINVWILNELYIPGEEIRFYKVTQIGF